MWSRNKSKLLENSLRIIGVLMDAIFNAIDAHRFGQETNNLFNTYFVILNLNTKLSFPASSGFGLKTPKDLFLKWLQNYKITKTDRRCSPKILEARRKKNHLDTFASYVTKRHRFLTIFEVRFWNNNTEGWFWNKHIFCFHKPLSLLTKFLIEAQHPVEM